MKTQQIIESSPQLMVLFLSTKESVWKPQKCLN